MDIYLFNFAKKKNSTDHPALSDGTKVTVTLKTPCSAMRPVFRLTKAQNPAFNYIYAPIGNNGRWYYVDDITYDGAEMLISCNVDVLATYKSTISSSTQYVERTSDTTKVCTQLVTDAYYQVGNQVTKTPNATTAAVFTATNGFYVVGIAAANINYGFQRGGITYVAMTQTQLLAFQQTLMTTGISLVGIIKPIDYIYSCVYIPFELPTLTSGDMIQDSVDMNDYSGITLDHIKSDSITSLIGTNGIIYKSVSVSTGTHPDAATFNFVKFAPFSRYRAYMGPFGEMDLPSDLIGTSVTFKIYVDITDGSSVCELYSNGTTVGKVRGKLGIPTALAQVTSNVVGIVGAITGVASGAGSIVAGNPIGGAIGIASSATSAIEAMIPKPQTQGQNGSYAELYDGYIRIISEFYRPIPSNNAQVGHMLMDSVTLSTLAADSYIQCRDARLAIDGYDAEMDAIIQYMNSGFYLE